MFESVLQSIETASRYAVQVHCASRAERFFPVVKGFARKRSALIYREAIDNVWDALLSNVASCDFVDVLDRITHVPESTATEPHTQEYIALGGMMEVTSAVLSFVKDPFDVSLFGPIPYTAMTALELDQAIEVVYAEGPYLLETETTEEEFVLEYVFGRGRLVRQEIANIRSRAEAVSWVYTRGVNAYARMREWEVG